jgi:hypothetical protein
MLISFSTLILGSQLIVAVADNVPDFNIEHGCKVDSASAFDPNAGLDATIKRCADDEQSKGSASNVMVAICAVRQEIVHGLSN